MRRRHFLTSAGAVAGLAAVPFAGAVTTPAPVSPFVLFRAGDGVAGTAFLPHSLSPCVDCTADVLEVSVDGLHAAHTGAVFEDFALHAMFDLPDGGSVPFVAWRHGAGQVPSRTDRVRFIANRATLRRFELEYRLAGGPASDLAACSLTRPGAPLLLPGHYVLIGPRRDGSRVELPMLSHSGDVAAPLSGLSQRDFDYLALRIEVPA